MRAKKAFSTTPLPSPYLVKLGLTPEEAGCYQSLLKNGAQTARQLSAELKILTNAVYRLTRGLTEKGFVVELDVRPIQFQAVPVEVAVKSWQVSQTQALEQTSLQAIQRLKDQTPKVPSVRLEVLTGWQKMMAAYVKMAKKAKEEILIISIGEPVPDEVKLVNRDALEKKIPVKFIIHKYDKSNRTLIESWVRMGVEVRHFPEAGYHLAVVDGRSCLLAASNPKNSHERISVVIESPGLAGALRQFFYSLWEKSIPIR